MAKRKKQPATKPPSFIDGVCAILRDAERDGKSIQIEMDNTLLEGAVFDGLAKLIHSDNLDINIKIRTKALPIPRA